jgi:hypothetical protein
MSDEGVSYREVVELLDRRFDELLRRLEDRFQTVPVCKDNHSKIWLAIAGTFGLAGFGAGLRLWMVVAKLFTM